MIIHIRHDYRDDYDTVLSNPQDIDPLNFDRCLVYRWLRLATIPRLSSQ
jgi:hypothetical protein